jgi:hypothetical protein
LTFAFRMDAWVGDWWGRGGWGGARFEGGMFG